MDHATRLDVGIVDSPYIVLGSMSIMFIERICWDATARSSGTFFVCNFVVGSGVAVRAGFLVFHMCHPRYYHCRHMSRRLST
jgi:hypothetical protein